MVNTMVVFFFFFISSVLSSKKERGEKKPSEGWARMTLWCAYLLVG